VTLAGMLQEKRLAVFLGPGGVGKTTISAACAMQASRERKSLVLTIDPARRLADAMGMRLGSHEVHVRDGLDAAMLDTKQALDELVTKYAPSPELLQRILRSPFYGHLSDAFAGSEEFVSAGKLYEYLQGGRYELIVVDTPPSSHALDFLEVPERLTRVFDSGAVQWLFKPSRLLRLAGGRAAHFMARWTSQQYLEDVAAFFLHFDRMFLEMEQRVRAMRSILTDPSQTGIAIVAAPEPASLLVAAQFHRALTERLNLPVDAVIVNRVLALPPRDPGMPEAELAALLAEGLLACPAVPSTMAGELARGIAHGAEQYRFLATAQEEAIAAFTEQVACDVLQVPALPQSVASLEGLERLRAAMFGR
jgi:anion-transporting  ArsA/GET3 family ATPase